MAALSLLKTLANRLPSPVSAAAERLYRRRRHWAHPSLEGKGTVQDLYFWVAEDGLDTLLLLQNYFSVFYPALDTSTKGSVTLFDSEGRRLGVHSFELAPFACAKITASSILSEMGVSPALPFGTLECRLVVPQQVLQETEPMYFFDRFYIGYTNGRGQPAFVHGVDRTHIYREDRPRTTLWYSRQESNQWAPEIPVVMGDYQRFSVIMLNRSNKPAHLALTVSDWDDQFRRWEATVQPRGAHRFQLTAENTAGLAPRELRLRIEGMPTKRGRPVVFKEFRNGAISVMHC